MPVYNGARFIQSSLSSLLNQLTSAFEVIVVDDGSVDNTVALIEADFQDFIARQQLVVISEKNQGVSAARNTGIGHAKGDYIGFMDADDLMLPTYVETVSRAIIDGSDIVEFGFKKFVDSVDETTLNTAEYSNEAFGHHATADIIDQVYSTARWYPWTRVFKRNLFDQVRFPVGVSFCEDLMTIPKLYEKSNTIVVLERAIYGYRSNANGATLTVGPNYVDNLIAFYDTIPQSGSIRHDYFKLSVAYAIYSCQMKKDDDWALPIKIQKDLFKLRYKWSIYKNVETRRIAILLFPKLARIIKNK